MDAQRRLHELDAARRRIAMLLTLAMILLYFGFIALIAFNRPLLAREVMPGLTLGILLGGKVIGISWILTLVYVWWANRHYDVHIDRLRENEGER